MPSLEVKQALHEFQNFVLHYDYSQLRAIQTGSETAPLYRASPAGIKDFLAGFTDKLDQSKNSEIREYFRRVAHHGMEEHENIIVLANVLLLFRQKIYDTECTYHSAIYQFSPSAALHTQLRNSDVWVKYFHNTIEKQLEDKALSYYKEAYRNALHSIQSLGRDVYSWIRINKVEMLDRYSILGSQDQQEQEQERRVNTSGLLSAYRLSIFNPFSNETPTVNIIQNRHSKKRMLSK